MAAATSEEIAAVVERVRRASKAVDRALEHRAHAQAILQGAEEYEHCAREEFNQARGALLGTAIGPLEDTLR
jgi:hypothetical protein